MLNDQLARRTGLTDAAGLDPKAIQRSTQIGVEAVINGAQERVAFVARVLAGNRLKDLFVGSTMKSLKIRVRRAVLKINGKSYTNDTSTFDATMSVEVNPNLGKGNDMVRMMALVGDQDGSASLGIRRWV